MDGHILGIMILTMLLTTTSYQKYWDHVIVIATDWNIEFLGQTS